MCVVYAKVIKAMSDKYFVTIRRQCDELAIALGFVGVDQENSNRHDSRAIGRFGVFPEKTRGLLRGNRGSASSNFHRFSHG